MSDLDYDIVQIGGRSKDVKVQVSRDTFQQGFVWTTVIVITVLFAILALIIWWSISKTNLSQPIPVHIPPVQKTINPIITTEEQCRQVPNATWTDVGCICQSTYTGDFCRAQLVTSFASLPVSTKFLSSEKIAEISGTTYKTCMSVCDNNLQCDGFVYDDNLGACRLFSGKITASKTSNSNVRKNKTLFMKNKGKLIFDDRVFLARQITDLPREYWSEADGEYFASIDRGKVTSLSFIPGYIKNSGLFGIYRAASFNKSEAKTLVNDPNTVIDRGDGRPNFPKTWKECYVLYTNLRS